MKRLLCACAILLVLFGISIWTGSAVEQLSNQYTRQLTHAQQLARQENWDQARSITQEVFQSWQQHNFFLHTLLRHSDTDQILLSFHSVDEYLRLQEMDQYAAANAQLITQLELMAEMEQPSLENIL